MTNTTRTRILIVDDDPDIRNLLTDVLVGEGYSVKRAGDGAEALEVLASTPMDAVLLDLHMRGMDGHEFLGRRAAAPRLAKIPVIIMSGSAQRPATTAGTSVLDKPIDIPLLLAMLDQRSGSVTSDPRTVTTHPGGDVAGVSGQTT